MKREYEAAEKRAQALNSPAEAAEKKYIFRKSKAVWIRRLPAAVLAAALCLGSLTACGPAADQKREQQSVGSEAGSDQSSGSEGSVEADPSELDGSERKKIAESMIGKDIEELVDQIGSADSETLSPSCETEGEDGIFEWDGCTVYTQSEKKGDAQIIQEVK